MREIRVATTMCWVAMAVTACQPGPNRAESEAAIGRAQEVLDEVVSKEIWYPRFGNERKFRTIEFENVSFDPVSGTVYGNVIFERSIDGGPKVKGRGYFHHYKPTGLYIKDNDEPDGDLAAHQALVELNCREPYERRRPTTYEQCSLENIQLETVGLRVSGVRR